MKNWRENLDFDKEQAAQIDSSYCLVRANGSPSRYVQEANDRIENEHRQALSSVLLYSYSKLGFLIVVFRIKKNGGIPSESTLLHFLENLVIYDNFL